MLDSQTILFTIDRAEVEAADVSRVSDFRKRLTSSRELALHCQGKIEFSFNGYGDDTRELFEIEVGRRYIALLDEVLFELFFFIRTDPPASTLRLIRDCDFDRWLGDKWSRPGEASKSTVIGIFHNRRASFRTVQFHSLNYICESLGLTEVRDKWISYCATRR